MESVVSGTATGGSVMPGDRVPETCPGTAYYSGDPGMKYGTVDPRLAQLPGKHDPHGPASSVL
jgi:hypothetical protein